MESGAKLPTEDLRRGFKLTLDGLPRHSYGRASVLARPNSSAHRWKTGLARTLALPNPHWSNISICNSRNSRPHLLSPGTSLDLPWYHPGHALVP